MDREDWVLVLPSGARCRGICKICLTWKWSELLSICYFRDVRDGSFLYLNERTGRKQFSDGSDEDTENQEILTPPAHPPWQHTPPKPGAVHTLLCLRVCRYGEIRSKSQCIHGYPCSFFLINNVMIPISHLINAVISPGSWEGVSHPHRLQSLCVHRLRLHLRCITRHYIHSICVTFHCITSTPLQLHIHISNICFTTSFFPFCFLFLPK